MHDLEERVRLSLIVRTRASSRRDSFDSRAKHACDGQSIHVASCPLDGSDSSADSNRNHTSRIRRTQLSSRASWCAWGAAWTRSSRSSSRLRMRSRKLVPSLSSRACACTSPPRLPPAFFKCAQRRSWRCSSARVLETYRQTKGFLIRTYVPGRRSPGRESRTTPRLSTTNNKGNFERKLRFFGNYIQKIVNFCLNYYRWAQKRRLGTRARDL
ncbi:hypothetical protein T492DRAFT_486763 [Pavlovales sp. CCMP2436]|nr:hypothetical protein T492DRAFT_486763 [Pavlovales sp. CCMP2436]